MSKEKTVPAVLNIMLFFPNPLAWLPKVMSKNGVSSFKKTH